MQPENNSAGAKVVTALIIGLILGFGAGAFWQERRLATELSLENESVLDEERAPAAASKKAVETQSAAAAVSGYTTKGINTGGTSENKAVLIRDQGAGGAVTVEQVISGEPVWVAVREERNGGPGNILGATRVAAGTHAAVAVELLRPTVAGRQYFVALHRDVGDAAFNYREDVLIEGVREAFLAQ